MSLEIASFNVMASIEGIKIRKKKTDKNFHKINLQHG
jgi:hypothetical protein